MKLRPRQLALAILLAGLITGNLVAWRHAVAMTTWAAEGARTLPPEKLSAAGKLRALLLGVTIPRPREERTPADLGLPFEEHRIDGPAGPLVAWRVPGGPRTVVLVHGYAAHRGALLDTALRLHHLGYAAVLPNLRGSGDSGGDGTTLGWGEADDVAAVVAALGGEKPVLYGFSMGGAAALGAVARAGVQPAAVVAEATFDRLITTTGHRFESMGLPARGPADLLLFWGGLHLGIDPGRVAPVLDAPSVPCPTLLVAGAEDARVRPDEARAIAAALPQGSLELVEGLPHRPLSEADPARGEASVASWLLQHAPPDLPSPTRPNPFRIAVTLDDLPRTGPPHPAGVVAANQAILAALQAHRVPATGFVTCDRVDPALGVLEAWRDTGMGLGNHQAAHDDLNKVAEERWLAGVARCDTLLREVLGGPVAFFRYPYLFNGPTPEVRDRVLAALTGTYGYTIGRVSVDNHEWKLAELYGKALANGDTERAAAISAYYPQHILAAVANFRAVSRRKLGRDVAHVLLLHDNALNADHLDDLLTALEGGGARFVPLEEALADPVYALPSAYEGKWGISWLYRIAPVDTETPWDDAAWEEIRARFGPGGHGAAPL
ncbi:MAG: alpha/beta fold hydrolase [Pseudomonadota bacterium]